MYIIINKTQRAEYKSEGAYPYEYVKYMLEAGDDLIIISLYSMTIKIPFVDKNYRNEEYKSGYQWSMKEYPLPEYLIKPEWLVNKGK